MLPVFEQCLPMRTAISTLATEAKPNDLGLQRSTKIKLLIVGNGMAGFGLCDRLDRNGSLEKFDVCVVGSEKNPAYDRVNLSRLFDPAFDGSLELASKQWYAERNISLSLGRRIVDLDVLNRRATDDLGQEYAFEQLVLATGSHAWVPPIAGVDAKGVFVYRTIEDRPWSRWHRG